MSVNGKRDEFDREDLIALAKVAGIKKTRENEMVECAIETVRRWPNFAEKAGVADARAAQIQANQRIHLLVIGKPLANWLEL